MQGVGPRRNLHLAEQMGKQAAHRQGFGTRMQCQCQLATVVPLRGADGIDADYGAAMDLPEVTGIDDNEKSFADLQERLDKTLAFLDTLKSEQFKGAETREVVLRPGTPKEKRFTGEHYLLHYGFPQFFFHVTTAYAILRSNGLEIGKGDFMGKY